MKKKRRNMGLREWAKESQVQKDVEKGWREIERVREVAGRQKGDMLREKTSH